MIDIGYTAVPRTVAEDLNVDRSVWRNGLYVGLDEGTHMTFYIGHHEAPKDRISLPAEDAYREVEEVGMLAFPVRVAKPVSRDAAINAAEMGAYSLRTPLEVASFAASLARKHRLDPDDAEVREHDEFIEWVRGELTAIGVK